MDQLRRYRTDQLRYRTTVWYRRYRRLYTTNLWWQLGVMVFFLALLTASLRWPPHYPWELMLPMVRAVEAFDVALFAVLAGWTSCERLLDARDAKRGCSSMP